SFQAADQVDGSPGRNRNSPVRDREGKEANAVGLAQFLFPGDVQLADFLRRQGRDDELNPGLPPGEDLVLQPVTAPRPGQDGQAAGPRPFDPENGCTHGPSPNLPWR